jgi:DNA-directed RNA polymerase subunit beta'
MGKDAVQQYLIDEIQKVYRTQGVTIHDKHIAVIVRQMLSNVRIVSSGDTKLLPGELVSRFDYEDINAKVLAEGGEPATAQAAFLGITRASLSKDSWLAAASFQETGRVLVDAAIKGKLDKLRGLKENVIPSISSLSCWGSFSFWPSFWSLLPWKKHSRSKSRKFLLLPKKRW